MPKYLKAEVKIKKCRKGSLMNLHHELGSATVDGKKIRFCQHINLGCFWLSIGDDLYQVDTEDLMNSVLNTVLGA